MKTRKFIGIVWIAGIFLSASAQQSTYRNRQDTTTQERQKVSYLTISALGGSSSLHYKLNSLNEKGTRSGALGYGIEVKYSYFWNEHWGVSTGVGASHSGAKGTLKGSLDPQQFYSLGTFTDDDWQNAPKDFELRARVTHLKEKQTVWLIDIPLMLSYQTYFGDSARWGIYGGLGVKLRIPVSSRFKIQDGANSQFNVSGQYDGIPTDMGSPGEPPVPQHGYGTITDPNNSLDWDHKAKLRMGIAGTAELGFLIDLGKNTDLLLGGYVDYGFNNLKKNGSNRLFSASAAYHPGANNGQVGKGIDYNGMLNSNVTDKIRLISFGGKIGIRFKL